MFHYFCKLSTINDFIIPSDHTSCLLAAFFTCTLLSVFGVQHHGYSLVPVECGVPYMPSSYPITFIIASLSMSVLTSLVTGVVSEGLVSDKPVRRGARIVREVET